MKRLAPWRRVVVLAPLLLTGCLTYMADGPREPAPAATPPDESADSVLRLRKVLVFGEIDEAKAKRTIRELLFLDSQGHEPIDLSPGSRPSPTASWMN
jgi:hypothetical protein